MQILSRMRSALDMSTLPCQADKGGDRSRGRRQGDCRCRRGRNDSVNDMPKRAGIPKAVLVRHGPPGADEAGRCIRRCFRQMRMPTATNILIVFVVLVIISHPLLQNALSERLVWSYARNLISVFANMIVLGPTCRGWVLTSVERMLGRTKRRCSGWGQGQFQGSSRQQKVMLLLMALLRAFFGALAFAAVTASAVR